MLTLESFEEAAAKVKEVTQETKLIYSSYFSDMTGNKVYLKPENMQRTGITKIDSPWFKIALAKNPPSVVVDDEDTLKFAHPEFVKVVTTESIDKAAIKEAIKAGQIVEGARLASSDRVTIK